MKNLANCYRNQGKIKEAEILLKECIDKEKSNLGDINPNVLSSMYDLEHL